MGLKFSTEYLDGTKQLPADLGDDEEIAQRLSMSLADIRKAAAAKNEEQPPGPEKPS